MAETSGPLSGVRVLDFTHILAGPYCTQFLADAGADVVKVEPPAGEFSRIRGPQRIGPDGLAVSSYYAAVNRGKRSLPINLKSAPGLALALRLTETADIVVENFAPGALSNLGLDLKELRARRPELITASITLYGGLESGGSRATRGGLAIVAEGESSVTGQTRDKTGTPIMLGLPLGDMASGLAAYAALTTALYARSQTGLGQHLDISMVRTLLALNAMSITAAQIASVQRHQMRTAGYGVFPAKDGFVVIAINNDSLFERLAGAMGRPELAQDPRYARYQDRDANADAVDQMIVDWASELTSDEVVARIAPSGVPCGKVTTPGDMLADKELRELGFLQTIGDGIGGTLDVPANPLGFSRGDAALPQLTEHARPLLMEAGLGNDEIDALAAEGAFGGLPV